MQQKHAWFGEQAFGKGTVSQVEIEVDSHRRATDYLHNALLTPGRIPVLRGPCGSGKHRIVSGLRQRLSKKAACAIVDGSKLQPDTLLAEAMRGFGYVTDLKSVEEHLHMVNVFAVQQLRTCQAPTLIVENIDQMFPSALRVLSVLAAFSVRGQLAIRMVLTSARDPESILTADGMVDVARRVETIHDIQPLSAVESMKYLHARLVACGVRKPDSIFPMDVCDRLHEMSGGWSGQLDTCAMAAIERALTFPLDVADTSDRDSNSDPGAKVPTLTGSKAVRALSPPKLIVSRHGERSLNIAVRDHKVLIGRSGLADVVLEDRFVSNAHALLLLYTDALVLLDLNSSNGTYVNSVRTRTIALRNNDIISLGHYRIKVQNAPARDVGLAHNHALVNTAKMKNLQDVRQVKRRHDQRSHHRQENHA